MKVLFKTFLLGLICLLLASMGQAQSSTTSIRGTVVDANGAVIQKAEVTLANPDTGFSRTGSSDAQGVYQVVQLPPGTYVLSVRYSGFATSQQTVQLLVDSPATVRVTMQLERTTTTVEVTGGELPQVNTQDATIGNAFSNSQVMSLPFEGRDPVGILSLQAAVAYVGDNVNRDEDSRNGAVAGARSDQTNVTLDGVDNNDQNSGYAFQGALRSTLDSLQEFRVTTSAANADTGRSSGAQVTLVTKSGTNKFHGSAYEYHRPTFTANDWFNKQAQLASGLENRPPKLIRNTFGASFGGPILKNRAFFFLNYEGQRTRENVQVTRLVPSESLRQGIMYYKTCGLGMPTDCDPQDAQPGVVQLTPAQITAMDPLGIGPSAPMLQLFNQYPMPNTDSVGDGYNFRGYTFSSPSPASLNTYIAKLDFNLTNSGNHRVFIRGNLQGDRSSGAAQFVYPDGTTTAPRNVDHTNNKGLAIGYTATLGQHWINNFRYGIIRPGYSSSGAAQGHYTRVRGIDDIEPITRTQANTVPLHNFIDDVNYLHGNHTIQFGGNLRLVNNDRANDLNSWYAATTNPSWLVGAGIANTEQGLDPGVAGYAPVADFFATDYNWPMGALVGIVAQVDATYNRNKAGDALPEGTPVSRKYKSYEMEYYVQDSWRAKSNLTLTFGLRYTLLQPPYEANGVQVQPTTNMADWYRQRYENMLKGISFKDPISFDLSGQANGKKPYWEWDKLNFAPRFAFAYSPNFENGWLGRIFGTAGKSSIRGGYGIYYDHFGQGVVNAFDQNGAFGLTTTLTNPANRLTTATAPRFTGIHDIPTTDRNGNTILLPPPPAGFPVTYPDEFAITSGLDDRLKTPYAHVFDFSITRELPKSFVVEVSYVGRLARRLLQQDDLAMPLDLVDPKSKTNYFSAAQALARMAAVGTDINQVGPIPYWENMFPGAAGAASAVASGCANGAAPSSLTATQAIYDIFACFPHNETAALQYMDLPDSNGFCWPSCSINGPYSYFDPQFSSLYSWRSIGTSSYHAFLLSVRRRMANGLRFDWNYTFSKSIDMGSDAERVIAYDAWGGPGGQIINSWDPKANRGLSDFDARHQMNANWTWELPFGKGKTWGSNFSGVMQHVFGGWEISGLFRWANSYPFSVSNGANWATNWQLGGNAVFIGPTPKTGQFWNNGEPNMFKDPQSAIKSWRYALPGERGSRNIGQGPGYFGLDSGVAKSWKITESQALKFRWEVFNVTNSPTFDGGYSVGSSLSSTSSFGVFNQTLTKPRIMQFALRYEF